MDIGLLELKILESQFSPYDDTPIAPKTPVDAWNLSSPETYIHYVFFLYMQSDAKSLRSLWILARS